ncbi:hypothetical protein PFICI_09810 [Pestalotiopsis fici W106-1]|uniref:Uncharacterized protein n=1 Tax=Pestalotiopsis fici (strain W106-1 / CGMCC3.15140) TaxID=1229662 RepID=W3WV60_PESFW|nr:uncharacterized protein PFICI_09810 [Pestalotiopsis fici W106-1]ETS77748.1 hypothetical protein PFICI_09810 [Pestalotiopsis fici W106-1]
MSMASSTFAALTAVFTPPPFCSGRYAVFIGTPTPLGGAPSTNTPSSGWIDPSFSTCNPPQYTNTYPTFSPGVCPSGMTIAASSSNIDGARTIWTGACCESGFSQLDTQYLCTSSVTTPMGFLLDPNISTADVFTTLSNLNIEHDQLAVLWEETDLPVFPNEVAAQYASIMGVEVPTSSLDTDKATTDATQSPGAFITPQPTSTQAISQISEQSSEVSTTSGKSPTVGSSAESHSTALDVTSFVAKSSASSSQMGTWLSCVLILFVWKINVF